jgi:hypothetical protein
MYAEAFDEQALKREWDEAVADGQDAIERKAAILRKAQERWPRVPSTNPGLQAQGQLGYHPEMRRFVRDVLGMPDAPRGGLNTYATQLLRYGAEGDRARRRAGVARRFGSQAQARQLRQAVVELTTKYRLGADPTECMEALTTKFGEIAGEQKA